MLRQVCIPLAGCLHDALQLQQREHPIAVGIRLLKELVCMLQGTGLVHGGSIPQRPDAPLGPQDSQVVICQYGPAPHHSQLCAVRCHLGCYIAEHSTEEAEDSSGRQQRWCTELEGLTEGWCMDHSMITASDHIIWH